MEDDPAPAVYEIHFEDDMLMIEASQGDNEIEVLISPALLPRIKEVIAIGEKLDADREAREKT